MAQCAAGCGFYATDGSVYCSKHLKEQAPDVQEAKEAYINALRGPTANAQQALLAVCLMPGFRPYWVMETIDAALADTSKAGQVLCLAECPAMDQHVLGKRNAAAALFESMVLKDVKADDAGFVEVFNSRHAVVDQNIMEVAIFKRHAHIRDMVAKLLTKATVTKRMVEAARYSCKRPANIPTPAKQEVVRMVEEAFKRARAAPSAEDDLPPSKCACAEVLACRFIAEVVLEAADGMGCAEAAVWTCGAYERGAVAVVDHSAHDAAVWGDQHRACDAVTASAEAWQPAVSRDRGQRFLCFFVSADQLLSRGVTADTVDGMVSELVQLPLRKSRSTEVDGEVVTKACRNTAKTFFHSRWHTGFNGDEVDQGISDQLQRTTAAFKAAVRTNTAVQCCFYSKAAEQFSCDILLAGAARHMEGGLVLLAYRDDEQDHVLFGS